MAASEQRGKLGNIQIVEMMAMWTVCTLAFTLEKMAAVGEFSADW